ncbi:MAG: tetratricopeptide repeat protein [Thermoflexales bacterium]|nr:tetratricopeptide repeat protein [Thermoflexales bacterium]
MPAPILATKLYVPSPRDKAVPRSRLIERLNEGARRKLTLISAPAGFGKTTLLSEWLAARQGLAAWLSLDEGDNDPVRFWSHVMAALQTRVANLGAAALGALQIPQPPPTETLLTTLLNEIATLADNFILVLDDYHVIDSQSVDQALTFLVEHLPPQLRLVIATREDPPLPLARLRVRGQLTELRAADLRFTPAEAADFLNRVMGLNLATEDIAALEHRTEGWIAGLQLAAISMQGRSDVAGFIGSFTGSHRFVLDYLMEEVLRHQPEPVRDFLLQTSVLDRLSGSLCNAVTDQADGQAMLETLERGNLFVIPLDDQRQWWRYHHLFAEVLQAHLKEAQPDRVIEIHRRASVWYEQHDLPADAIRHALAAKEFDRAAGLIELAGPATEDGRIQSAAFLGWLKALPAELMHVRPVLNVWYGYTLLGRGEMEAAAARLQDAERWLESTATTTEMVVVDHEQFKSLPATIAIGRAYIAQACGNTPDTVRYASRVLELAPEGEHRRRSQAAMMLGMTHWADGNLPAAERVFADYTLRLRAAGNLPDAISTSAVLAEIRLALGRLREAIETVEQCLQYVRDQGEPVPLDTADLHRELGELYLEQGNREAAAQHLRSSKELGEKAELPVWRYQWCIAQARLNEARGDLEAALAMLAEAERRYIRSPLPDFCPLSAMKARIWVAQGKLTKSLEWVREQGLAPDDDLSYLHEFEHITLARILIAHDQDDRLADSISAALRLLDRLLHAAEESRRIGSVIEISIVQALAYQAQGNTSAALVALDRALTLAEPEGYVRIFVDEGESMRWLLEKQAHGREHQPIGYAAQLLAAFAPPATILPSAVRQPQSTLIEPLSERELEVLQHIAAGLTNREIADRLYLSLYTVKAHARSIYDKLDAHSRTQAVARARELGVLPQP